jgi:iron(III) transport system ATP-binding protein
MTAYENVAFPLKTQRLPRAEVTRKVGAALEMAGIPELSGQRPGNMSGGQQQRVALARALVADAKYVLFDEPLSNVDAKVRERLRAELSELQKQIGFAGLYVTHDQVEALQLGTRVAVMRAGRIVQMGTPQEVYQEPTSRYVANFVGSVNEFDGRVLSADASYIQVHSPLGRVVAPRPRADCSPGATTVLLCRPETVQILDSARERPSSNTWPATIVSATFSGPTNDYVVRVGEAEMKCSETARPMRHSGDELEIYVPIEAWRLIEFDVSDTEAGLETGADTDIEVVAS